MILIFISIKFDKNFSFNVQNWTKKKVAEPDPNWTFYVNTFISFFLNVDQ